MLLIFIIIIIIILPSVAYNPEGWQKLDRLQNTTKLAGQKLDRLQNTTKLAGMTCHLISNAVIKQIIIIIIILLFYFLNFNGKLLSDHGVVERNRISSLQSHRKAL